MKEHRFNNESDLRKYVCDALNKTGFTQKLECRDLNTGVPDMVYCSGKSDTFIELKLEKCLMPEDELSAIKVHWRPGQQGWAFLYRNAHKGTKSVLTLIAYDNAAVIVVMTEYFKSCIVGVSDYIRFSDINKAIDWLVYRGE